MGFESQGTSHQVSDNCLELFLESPAPITSLKMEVIMWVIENEGSKIKGNKIESPNSRKSR